MLDLRASLPLTAHAFLHCGLVAGGLLVEPRLMKARRRKIVLLWRNSKSFTSIHTGTLYPPMPWHQNRSSQESRSSYQQGNESIPRCRPAWQWAFLIPLSCVLRHPCQSDSDQPRWSQQKTFCHSAHFPMTGLWNRSIDCIRWASWGLSLLVLFFVGWAYEHELWLIGDRTIGPFVAKDRRKDDTCCWAYM